MKKLLLLPPRRHRLASGARSNSKPGDSIAILGNALPDRSQHFGWLETLLTQANADKDLTFRNLAFSGDEVQTWHRIDNFGTRDEWLAKVKSGRDFRLLRLQRVLQGLRGH
jgi:hypothetical protein